MFRAEFPLDDATRRIREAQGKLQQDKKNLLNLLGAQLLSLAQQAYRKKARRERGDDGITWARLKRSTIKARVLQRAPGRRIVEQRKQIARQIQQLLATRKRKGKKKRTATRRRSRGASTRRARMGRLRRGSPTRAIKRRLKSMPKIKGKGGTIREQVLKLRRRRLELLLKLEQLVDREFASHEIGVNTGLQRSSASPGFSGSDGKGGNVFDVAADQVTVGFNRNYSGYFDEKRQLMPDVMPQPWMEKMDDITTRWADKIVREALG